MNMVTFFVFVGTAGGLVVGLVVGFVIGRSS